MISVLLASALAIPTALPSSPPRTLGPIEEPTPLIFTVAGTGSAGNSPEGGLAIQSHLSSPQGVAIDRDGNIIIADSYNHVVRRVGAGGIVTNIADLTVPLDAAVAPDGTIYITTASNVYKIGGDGVVVRMLASGYGETGDGGPANLALVMSPNGISVDGDGNIFFADRASHRIRRIDTKGIITTVAGNGTQGTTGDGGQAVDASLYCPYDVDVDQAGRLYIADPCVGRLRVVETDGRIWTPLATSAGVWFVEVSPEGEVYFGSRTRGEIRKLDSNLTVIAGQVFTGYSGDGGPASSARLDQPRRLAFDRSGNLYVAEEGNSVIRKLVRSSRSTWHSDFDGDGASDLLWRNAVDGQPVAWMRWSGRLISDIEGEVRDDLISWTGDFDGDGASDLLWRDPSTGANSIWPMADASLSFAIAGQSTGWQISGVGDFDGDGADDILWQHPETGAVTIWPRATKGEAVAAGLAKPAGFTIVDINDYDGNGRDDVYWHDRRTGANAIWFGGDEASELDLPPMTDRTWIMSGSGDFDGDGCSDIVWRSLWGPVMAWKCARSERQISLGDMELGYKVHAIADHDGDRKSDIFWRNGRSGKNRIWAGGKASGQAQVPDVHDEWYVVQ